MLKALLDLHNEYYISQDHARFWQMIEDEELAEIFRNDIDRRLKRHVAIEAAIESRISELDEFKDVMLKTEPPTDVKLSGAMIVKNEEAFVEYALLSIYDVCDEICVLDTGSTDGTPDIVGKYPKVKLKVQAMPNFDFSYARNMNFNMCSGDNIQVHDADELLMGASSLYERFDGKHIYFAELTEMVNGKAVHRSTQPRVFPKGSIIWKNRVHNRPALQRNDIGLHCERNTIPLFHLKDYKKESGVREERTKDFADRIKNKEPDSFKKFYMLTRLHMGSGDHKKAVKVAAKAFDRYKLLSWPQMKMYQDFLLTYARALYAGTRFSEASEPLYLHAAVMGLTTDSAFFNHALAASRDEHFLAAQFLERHFELQESDCAEPYYLHTTLQFYDNALLLRDIYRYWIENLRIA